MAESVPRKTAILLIQEGIRAADPEKAIMENVQIIDNKLKIKEHLYKLAGDIYVVGAGKATGGMAQALERILGDRIKEGVIAIPEEIVNNYSLRKIKIIGSTHPKPSEKSVLAGKEVISIVKKASEEDLVIALFSGGGSALLEYPVEGISINDIQYVSIKLMNAGANIVELNAVRKHLSKIKGGWLAKHAYPSQLVSLMISDVVGDRLDTIASGPTVPDLTTFNDAVSVLKKYNIWDGAPDTVRKYLEKGLKGEAPETPKPEDEVFKKVSNIIIASNSISLEKMKEKAKKLGYNVLILTSYLEGEAREVGKVLASIAKEIKNSGSPIKPPAVILAGGETTVTVKGKGLGGRNQELALSAGISIEGLENVAIASVGSDGRDGPTDVAGAVVDGETMKNARKKGLDPYKYLEDNNSYEFFRRVGGHIITGYTGTNVNDLIVIVVK